MSYTFAKINGRKEIVDLLNRHPIDYGRQEMRLTRFAAQKSKMLQISIEDKHIQLTPSEVEALIASLLRWKEAPEIDY